MLIELSDLTIILLNCLGIPAVHIGISYLCEKTPTSLFQKPLPSSPQKPNPLYQKTFHLRRWKHLLPDAAPWMKGFPKATLQSTDPNYLKKFITETRRGELAHWLQWLLITLFIIWNPFPANLIIILYASLMNFPCLLNLRHTRRRLTYLLAKDQLHPKTIKKSPRHSDTK